MQSPAYRIDLRNGHSGEVLKTIPLDFAMESCEPFAADQWPIDADIRCVLATMTGYPLEIRIRRIL